MIMRTLEDKYYRRLAETLLEEAGARIKGGAKPMPSKRLVKSLVEVGDRNHITVGLVLDCIFNNMLPGLNNGTPEIKSKEEIDISAFRYVPSNRDRFVRYTLDAFSDKKNFIDVGAGYADKVALAYEYGDFDFVNGIEMNHYTYSVSLFLLDNFYGEDVLKSHDRHVSQWEHHKIMLTRGNAFDYDFSEHDAVYMYMPIHDREILERLHVHVLNTMPKGGVLYEEGSGWFNKRGRYIGDEYARAIGWDDDDDDDDDDDTEVFTYEEYVKEFLDVTLNREIEISSGGHVVTVVS